MTKGVLLFCFDTEKINYHKILERCVHLIKKNLRLEITVVTNFDTYKKLKPLGLINYKFVEPEQGNTRNREQWLNVDRHLAYELSPYDVTLVMDIDYFVYTDNLKQFLDTDYDFLISKQAHDLSGRNSFDLRKYSLIDMVWATVFIFRKGKRARRIFDTVKYVKSFYAYFTDMYRIYDKKFRNDYAFAIALQQSNGFMPYHTLPLQLPTLPPDCEIVKISDTGIAWQYNDEINYVENQDVHVLNKEMANA